MSWHDTAAQATFQSVCNVDSMSFIEKCWHDTAAWECNIGTTRHGSEDNFFNPLKYDEGIASTCNIERLSLLNCYTHF